MKLVPFRFLCPVAGVVLFTVSPSFFAAAQDRCITASPAFTKEITFANLTSYGGGSTHTDYWIAYDSIILLWEALNSLESLEYRVVSCHPDVCPDSLFLVDLAVCRLQD